MNRSIPTSTNVEFVNVSPLNPMISRCEIKILYTGLNRNKTFIRKEVAVNMAKTLPGTPIVGEYLSKDFGDHGTEDLRLDENGLRFIKSTVPYGFIPTDAKIWWQTFLDQDGIEREYLLTEGYLWSGRYPETTRVLERGNGQSMEFDRDSLKGNWTEDENGNCNYFNIEEAFFSALCILGEGVEPCFEGASIKKPELIYNLDKDDFKSQLSKFMLDLKDALNIEGGKKMDNGLDNNLPDNADEFAKKKKKDGEEDQSKDGKEKVKEKESEGEGSKGKEKDDEGKDPKSGTPKNKDKKKKKKKKIQFKLEDIEEYVTLSKDYLALNTKYEALVKKYSEIEPMVEKFQAEENARELTAKEDMIKKFYMLDEADIADVKENIGNFSLNEIESKLCVIAVRKKVNFNLDTTDNSDRELEKPITTFNMDGVQNDSTPAWLKAVENRTKK